MNVQGVQQLLREIEERIEWYDKRSDPGTGGPYFYSSTWRANAAVYQGKAEMLHWVQERIAALLTDEETA